MFSLSPSCLSPPFCLSDSSERTGELFSRKSRLSFHPVMTLSTTYRMTRAKTRTASANPLLLLSFPLPSHGLDPPLIGIPFVYVSSSSFLQPCLSFPSVHVFCPVILTARKRGRRRRGRRRRTRMQWQEREKEGVRRRERRGRGMEWFNEE